MSGRHAHLRADPQARRKGYWAVIWSAIAVAAVSAVDMLMLDSMLFFGVLAAYGALVVMSVLLFFSRRRKDQAETYQVSPAPEPGELTLKCTTCEHLFQYDEQTLRSHAGWAQACPNCRLVGPLPAADAPLVTRGGAAEPTSAAA